MYIKLIQPKMRKRPMDTDIKTHMSPPLGLYTIVNMLRTEHRVYVENENIANIDFSDKPDIVGISVTVDTFPRAAAIAKRFRKRSIPVVAGGIHITTAFDFIPQNCFDVLCVGAAEFTWNDIVKDLERGELKPVYRCSKNITGADIVSPAYDMIKNDSYLYCNIIHTSRGCPYKCDFCYNSSAERHYVNRNIDDVIADIKAVGKKHVMFIDDNFTGNPKWTKKFLERIKPMKLKWNAAVSIDIAKRPMLLELMKESGCMSLFIGFESINKSSVSGVHKVQNRAADYDKAVKIIHSKGIMINASFVFGLDSDTPDVFEKTLYWVTRNKIETVTSHILTPYPGTKLYDDMLKSGRLIETDLSFYNTANVVFKPANMTPEQLYSGYLWIYRNIYSLPCIIKRMPNNFSQAVPYLLFNLFYRKYGKLTDGMCKLFTYNRIGYLAEKLSKYL